MKILSKLLLFIGKSKPLSTRYPPLLLLIKSFVSWFSDGTSSIIDSFLRTSSKLGLSRGFYRNINFLGHSPLYMNSDLNYLSRSVEDLFFSSLWLNKLEPHTISLLWALFLKSIAFALFVLIYLSGESSNKSVSFNSN